MKKIENYKEVLEDEVTSLSILKDDMEKKITIENDEINEIVALFLNKTAEKAEDIYEFCEFFYDTLRENPDDIIKVLELHHTEEIFDDQSSIEYDDPFIISLYLNIIGEISFYSKKYSEFFYQHLFFHFAMNFVEEEEYEVIESSLHLISSIIYNGSLNKCDVLPIFEITSKFCFSFMNSPLYVSIMCFGIVKNYDYEPFLMKIVSCAEDIRNAESDTECNEYIAKMCVILLKNDKDFIKIMDRRQLLGGLLETLEEQYKLLSFTKEMKRFQFTIFELLSEVVDSTTEEHAIDILEMIPLDYLENVIEYSESFLIVPLLEIFSFVLSCQNPSYFSEICFRPKVLAILLDKYSFNTFDSMKLLVRFISKVVEHGTKEIVDIIIEEGYINNCISALENEGEASVHFISSILSMISIYEKENEENIVINCILDIPDFRDLLDELCESDDDKIAEIANEANEKIFSE